MVELRNALARQGVGCDWPTSDLQHDPNAMSHQEAARLIELHLQRIETADAVFLFNKDGYLGASAIMELGYAYALRKPIYSLVPVEDVFLKGLVTAVCGTEDLVRCVKRRS